MSDHPLNAVNNMRLPDVAAGPGPGPVLHGRERELAALHEVLADRGIAVVTGPPGIGKTTLATRLAHDVADRFPDGVLRADLARTRVDDVRAWFSRELRGRGRRVLLLLFNVREDHDLEEFRNYGAALIATSVEQRLGGVPLGPLGVEDSLALLRTHLGPRLDEDPGQARALVEACGRHPLALTVAAKLAHMRRTARLATLVEEIPVELGEVRSTFAWAYGQLSAADAEVFHLLGTGFEDEFSIDAFTALAGGDARPFRNRLLELHLLEDGPDDRIVVHGLVREYARTLAPRDPEALGRLLDHYVEVADSEPVNAAAAVFLADDRRRVALAARLVDSMSVEVQTAAVAAARAIGDRDGEALALAHLGHAYLDRESFDEAEECFVDALEIRREPRALSGLGNLYLEDGGVEEATALFEEVLSLRVSESDEVRACLNLGRATGELSWFERARDVCARTGDAERLGRAWNGMGVVHHRAGRYAEAIACYSTALKTFVDGDCLLNLGQAQDACGESSLSSYSQAAECAIRSRDLVLLADAARLLHEAGYTEEALRRMKQAESLHQGLRR
ncbi:tetratricopeptide repeat protein [Lentzea sp.]|uniref:tetratricopeptide repeat protein n=1 Tax=Lentzea sp. TaxID=56099 RepID=UPI002C074223|nr:tetratricopeptide repeat protein [Lentzea sp.]HUQ61405.1 tetratricopeptide repeat protein [Lentzea sp.]